MGIAEIARLLQARLLVPAADWSLSPRAVCAADLMSDVLTFAAPGSLLLTGLANSQVIRTAEIAGIPAVVFLWGKEPPPEALALAAERGIAVLASDLPAFEACGRLYRAGLRDGDPVGLPGRLLTPEDPE